MPKYLSELEFEFGQRVMLPNKVAGRGTQGMIFGCEASMDKEPKYRVQYLMEAVGEGGRLEVGEVVLTEAALAEAQPRRR